MKVVGLILMTLVCAINAKNCQSRGQCCSDPNEEYQVSGFEYTCKDFYSIEKDSGAAGCFCKSGYVRNAGKCIPTGKCPTKCNGPYEIHYETACACDPDYTCDGRIYNNTQAYPKCHCIKGYVRNNGKCIPKHTCPKCRGPNEIPKETGCDYTCDLLIYNSTQSPGCYCKLGYVRDKNGICIPKNKCPPKCKGPNEIHPDSQCGCGPDYTCCGLIYNNTQGHPTCHCKKGYVRDIHGKCIPKSECELMCDGPNEIHNVTGCDYTCDNLPYIPARDDCCYCKLGYVRDKNGICIPKAKCPPKCKGPNEIHPDNQCGCGPDYTCCGLIYNNTQGYPKCHCKKGYVRDIHGKCIPKSECELMCDGPNEIHNVTGCDYTCDNLPYTPARDDCCYCKLGYVRDKNGICIPKDECPPSCNDPNEIHPDNECGCGPDYTCCGLIYNNTQGHPRCHCKKGYVRDIHGKCIPKSECELMCDGPNEIHNVTGCDYTCDNLPYTPARDDCCYCKLGYVRDKNGICIPKVECPPSCNDPNEIHPDNECGCGPDYTCCGLIYNNTQGHPRCHCKKGYVRDIHGKCIPKSECELMCDGPNEIHNVTGCDYTCDNLPYTPARDDCCYCELGYVRDKNGICIPKDECPPICNDPNEIHPNNQCGCGPDYTCCGLIYNNTQGHPRCHCKKGYVRDIHGKCIPKSECELMCDGPNEIHNVTGCDYTCDNLPYTPARDDCCYCKLGYVRDKNGICIPKDECPPSCNDPNEIHPDNECGCGPDYTCCGLIYNNTQGHPRCHCKKGYVRDIHGKCIPKSECELMCDGPNEIHNVTGCDYTCDNLPYTPARDDCCYCILGYVRDKNGICIPKDECPPRCNDPNEIHPDSQCGCGPDYTCCGLIYNNTQGYPKCHCEKGHVRNDNGKCIPKGECPPKCSGPNTIYKETGCDNTCDGPLCKPIKRKGCYCKQGYVRNSSGKCIPEGQCPPKCGPNEVQKYVGFDYTCGGIICVTSNVKTGKACYCKPGFVRNAARKCILQANCPR